MWTTTPIAAGRAGVLTLAAAFVSACSSTPPPPVLSVTCSAPTAGPRPDSGPALVTENYGTVASPIPLNAVLMSHEGLARNVAVQALYSARTEAGTVQVTARLVSCLDEPLRVRARTSFLTKTTAPAEAPSAWQNVHLTPRATALYVETSLARDEVGQFLIEIAP